jgi:hypothetical protein
MHSVLIVEGVCVCVCVCVCVGGRNFPFVPQGRGSYESEDALREIFDGYGGVWMAFLACTVHSAPSPNGARMASHSCGAQ